MNDEISCGICMDLMPLVKDGVAGEESCAAVKAHLEHCEACRALWKEEETIPPMDEARVYAKIKKQLSFLGFGIILVGIQIGIGLSGGAGVFYNAALMPALGAAGFFFLREKFWVAPSALFLMSYVREWMSMRADGMNAGAALAAAFFWPFLYCGFCLLGGLIGWLFYIAFRKETKK